MTTARNQLIERLPDPEQRRLLSACETVELVLGDVLCEPDEPMLHVHFPTDGFISLVVLLEGHPGLEVGMVGREGMVGAQVALGTKATPWRAVVQGGGTALRVERAAFGRELTHGGALQRSTHSYLSVVMAQGAASTACVRFHAIGPRLARWLLMSQDRAHADDFQVTHEFLAYMLGVRRVGVTIAASALQRGGLIAYHRGRLRVLDRHGLEAAACSCYARDRAIYAEGA